MCLLLIQYFITTAFCLPLPRKEGHLQYAYVYENGSFIDSYSAGLIPDFRSPNLESQIIEDRA